MRVCGVDPDTKHCSIAVLNNGRVETLIHQTGLKSGKGAEPAPVRAAKAAVWAAQHFREAGKVDRLVVEGQQYYKGGATAAQALFGLASGTGAAVASLWPMLQPDEIHVPTPFEWKGNQPKHICQSRLCGRVGWNYTTHRTKNTIFIVPQDTGFAFSHIQWDHVLDALGLAYYGLDPKRKLKS